MKWETIKIDDLKKECRFTVKLDYHRLTLLKRIMEIVGTKQKAKAIKYLLDRWERDYEIFLMRIEEEFRK